MFLPISRTSTHQTGELMSENAYRGLHHRRTEDNCLAGERERWFSTTWEQRCRLKLETTGNDTPQTLMFVTNKNNPDPEARRCAFRLTTRDRVIIATIIQWLGTSVGWAFLERALQRCGYRIVKDDGEEKAA